MFLRKSGKKKYIVSASCTLLAVVTAGVAVMSTTQTALARATLPGVEKIIQDNSSDNPFVILEIVMEKLNVFHFPTAPHFFSFPTWSGHSHAAAANNIRQAPAPLPVPHESDERLPPAQAPSHMCCGSSYAVPRTQSTSYVRMSA